MTLGFVHFMISQIGIDGEAFGAIMIELELGEREYMVEMRMLTTDAEGREVLVGLTEDETDFYLRYSRARIQDDAPRRSDADRDCYLAICEKHERARFQVLGAEHELRVGRPTRN